MSVHSCGVVHLDIKKSNFCLPYGKSDPLRDQIYLIDFGCAQITTDEKGKYLKGAFKKKKHDLRKIGHILIDFKLSIVEEQNRDYKSLIDYMCGGHPR
jgi:serine/threonine protein kinase